MSNKKKPRKLRRPNVPGMAAPAAAPTPGASAPEAPAVAPPRPDAARAGFDYAYVARDLRRIGLLGASFVGLLVVLSFFIR
jgi:hypothetical protein